MSCVKEGSVKFGKAAESFAFVVTLLCLFDDENQCC
jgi:hypothetical protein